MKHHGNVHTPCGDPFFFNKIPTYSLITPIEDFYVNNNINAFNGKGSPDEIIDTLRLAMLIGRFGTDRDACGQPPATPTAQAYATQFMTLDCNALVGNYFGGNSSADISSYAKPAQRRNTIGEVRPGDVVVTHCATHHYEHVGLIQEWTVSGDTAAIRLVEWGWFGSESVHYSQAPISQKITRGPETSFGIGWSAKSAKPDHCATFRYVFAPPAKAANPNGWP